MRIRVGDRVHLKRNRASFWSYDSGVVTDIVGEDDDASVYVIPDGNSKHICWESGVRRLIDYSKSDWREQAELANCERDTPQFIRILPMEALAHELAKVRA